MNIIKIEKTKINDVNDSSTQFKIGKLRKQFQSSNINILLGAGFSYGVASLLGNIENKLYIAEYENKDPDEVVKLKKEFFTKSISPMADQQKVKIGEPQRVSFVSIIKKIIENRQSSILHKIINVFTTNYDMLVEIALEKSHSDYIDGFSGKLSPKFSTANYGMIMSRQTSISSMTSEMVTFNLYKVHGSLNWKRDGNEIVCCDYFENIKNIENHLEYDDFQSYYKSLAIINPTKDKLNETVLNVHYYDQLRMYCNELEKSNTILIAFGFSFADEHIREMTQRALKGNPTFNMLVFSFNEESTQQYQEYFNEYANVTVFQLIDIKEDEEVVANFNLEHVNALLEEVLNGTK